MEDKYVYEPDTEKGKLFEIRDDLALVLYPISELSRAMQEAGVPRSIQSLRKWEEDGVTPQALFRESERKRMYTPEQIQLFVDTALECGVRQGKSLANTGFPELIWMRMRELNQRYLVNGAGGDDE